MTLNLRSAMPTQVFISDSEEPPQPERFIPAANSKRRVEKPHGGLWTSTYQPDSLSLCAWEEWCRKNQWSNGDQAWRIVPKCEATVVEIDEHEHLKTLAKHYGRDTGWRVKDRAEIDFDGLRAAGIDGVHLTEQGLSACSGLFGDAPRLYGWDCESTVWLRWCFEDDIRRLDFPRNA